MKISTINASIKVVFIFVLFFGSYAIYENYLKVETIKIANWNLQIFGQTKESNQELMDFYSSVIDDYDIIFIQEIRDKSEKSFSKLCSMLTNYICEISSRAGRGNNKEQYGIIYKNKIILKNFYDYNPDEQDRWERPPIRTDFKIKNYSLTIYNIHTKPEDVQIELNYLEEIAIITGNVIIIGDLNADCDYYDNEKENEFEKWNWVVGDREDTTSTNSNCAYDRILINSDAKEAYHSSGVYKKQITPEISDHYIVWLELEI